MATDPYLIPGTNTLKNKLGITNESMLQDAERELTGARIASLVTAPIAGKHDFEHLKAIHKHIFQDLYEWAGKARTITLSKGETGFAPAQNIDSFGNEVFGKLKGEDHLKGLDREKFTERAAHYFGEINALHPFREGNGRTQREFIASVAQNAGYSFDWSRLTQQEMIDASKHSYAVDSSQLKALLDKALAEPLKKKDRKDRLEDLAANDPKAHTTIVDIREKLLTITEKNIADPTSRENFANAVTDRLLDHHDKGQSVEQLVQPPPPKIDRDPNDRGR